MTEAPEPLTQIVGIDFTPEGLGLGYMRVPKDVRKNGLVWQHQVLVPHGSDYDDEIEALMDAAQALLADVLDDEDRAEPIDPPGDEEDDDED